MKYFALLFLGAGLATAVQAAATITPLPVPTFPQPGLNASTMPSITRVLRSPACRPR